MTIIAGTPEEFAALQKDGIEQFGEIVKAAASSRNNWGSTS